MKVKMAPQPQEFEGKTNLPESLPKSIPESVTVESVSETEKSDKTSKMSKRVNPFTPSTPEGDNPEVSVEPGHTAIGTTDVKSGIGEGETGNSEGKSGISEGKTGVADGKTGKTEGKTGIAEGRKRTKSVDTEIPLEIGNTMKGITESIPETVNGIPQPLNGNHEVTNGVAEGKRTVPRRRSMRKITVEGMSNGGNGNGNGNNGNEPSTPDKNVDKNGNQSPDFDDKMLDFDDVLPHMGEFGLYQKLLFVLLAPFAFFVAFVYFTQIFITLTPEEHWCRVPGLDQFNLSLYDTLHLTIPRSAVNRHVFDKCLQYDVNFTEVLSAGVTDPKPEWRVVPCRNGWDFNYTDVPYTTIASELGWVCENAALGSIAQAVFFFGAILGGLIFGWMADHYGRIPALVGTNVIGLVAGCATALCNSFWAFCVCRFLVGLAFDNCFTMMYILVLEYVGPKWRTFVANMSIAMYFTLASCLLPWMAYWIADWRWLCVATSAPLALAIITPWIVPESARWLVSQGKIDKALVIMKKFEKINGTKVDPQIYKQFTESCYKIQKEEEADKSYSVLDLFRSPRLRNITLLLIAIWMAISLCFDGHVRNVGSLGLDLFVTFTVAAATELPADTLLTLVLDRWGRRWLACGSMCMSGIFSLLAATVPPGAASASLAIMGRFSVNISYNIGLQYAAELLPTVVRAQGVALIHIMGYVASILAPFIVLLAVISPGLPLVVLGSLGVVGGLLSLFLPETLDKELPQTLQDGENFGRGQRMLDFPCCNKRIEEDPPVVPTFRRRSYGRASARASIRGATYRSTMIQRSTRQRHSAAAENNAACNT